MRPAITAAPLIALLGIAVQPCGPTFAAEGDLWAVDRQNVNVRSGPSTNTDVLMTVNPGERIVEIAAKGDWFFVEFPDYGKRGWVFAPLLIKQNAAETPAPSTRAATPAPSPAAPATTVEDPVAPASEPAALTQTAAVSDGDEPAAVKSFAKPWQS